ncbi:hypothetical protein CAEBREN_06813 [Caenorhabditis brenneri]|uniref:BTB domain-containing protein n=1 Tax=Caenorhabditis brenneri TaxID=135651 RepID=G0N3T3_CAEBE|nr:hypothetical protein CAEBREN_06813 [Caenorhabditis brenneri]
MPRHEKKFTLSHIIDLSQITHEPKNTETEPHFSIPWCMAYHKSRSSTTLCFGVLCLYTESDEWEIQTELTFRIKSSIGNTTQLTTERSFQNTKDQKNLSWWWNESVSFERIQKYVAENGKVEIEADVVIKKMNGFGIEKLRYFDEHSQKHWDVVLIVNGHKFYSMKAFLACQSPYFDKLLFGSFKEATQSEVEMKEVDHDDFQSFLELIHGESAVNDTNIDGVLHLADMFDTPTAIRRCEEFLLVQSKWSLDEKEKLAERYHLKDLMIKLQLSSIEEEKEELKGVVAKPVKKPSKSPWFSCIRKQRD